VPVVRSPYLPQELCYCKQEYGHTDQNMTVPAGNQGCYSEQQAQADQEGERGDSHGWMLNRKFRGEWMG
jgi:hypothetical protein